MNTKTTLLLTALLLLVGPWGWAFISAAIEPKSAQDQGVFTMAFYLTFILGPIALALAITGLLMPRKKG